MKEELITVGDYAVIFNYTNTKPKDAGLVVSETEHFIEIERGFWKKRTWYPKTDAQKVIASYQLPSPKKIK